MAKYLFVYRGGEMGGTPEEQQKGMDAWMGWFGTLGAAVIDPGSPFGESQQVSPGGRVTEGGDSGLSGYSIVEATSMTQATDMATGCPVLHNRGYVEIYEVVPVA